MFIKVLGNILFFILFAYLSLLILNIILSWKKIPASTLTDIIKTFTNPVLSFFKKRIPLKIGVVDLSPIFPIGIGVVLLKFIYDLMISGMFVNIFYYLLDSLLFIISYAYLSIGIIYILFTMILLIIEIQSPETANPFVNILKIFINPILKLLKKAVKLKSGNSNRNYLIILIVILFVLTVFGQLVLSFLYFKVHNMHVDKLSIPMEETIDIK